MKKCINLKIGKTTIIKKYDENPDTSYLGEYSDDVKPGCIIRSTGEFIEDLPDDEDLPSKGREYRFYHPCDNGEKINTPDYRKYAKQDYKRMEDLNKGYWSYIGLIVKTQITTDLGLSDEVQDSIWGIESDDKSGIERYIKDLKYEVKSQLLKMGFKDKEINQSLDNAIEVD